MKLKPGTENDDLALAFFEEVQESETTGVDSGLLIPKIRAEGSFHGIWFRSLDCANDSC